ncbi:MAG: hypothetical protein JO237_07775 [Pseudolabrys sp.]|nr:hypothetical protein [Pseudolabrys sp.]
MPHADSVEFKVKNFGSVDLRLGYAMGSFLPYLIGAARARVRRIRNQIGCGHRACRRYL